MTSKLEDNGEGDYTLPTSESSVWVIVDGVALWIRRGKANVIVEAYKNGDEMGEMVGELLIPLPDSEGADG